MTTATALIDGLFQLHQRREQLAEDVQAAKADLEIAHNNFQTGTVSSPTQLTQAQQEHDTLAKTIRDIDQAIHALQTQLQEAEAQEAEQLKQQRIDELPTLVNAQTALITKHVEDVGVLLAPHLATLHKEFDHLHTLINEHNALTPISTFHLNAEVNVDGAAAQLVWQTFIQLRNAQLNAQLLQQQEQVDRHIREQVQSRAAQATIQQAQREKDALAAQRANEQAAEKHHALSTIDGVPVAAIRGEV